MDIIDQIIFWTEISKEHPLVINEFAGLSNIQLPPSFVAENLRYNQRFEDIQNQAIILKGEEDGNWNGYEQRELPQELTGLVRQFATTDQQWIILLNEIMRYGQGDAIFQTLIQHIIDEQTYAYHMITSATY